MPTPEQRSESQQGENITENPKSWVAWKKEAARLQALNAELMSALEAARKAILRSEPLLTYAEMDECGLYEAENNARAALQKAKEA